jgi:orotidine-5'-phosphate decarboxylase
MPIKQDPSKRLIIALDVENKEHALTLVGELREAQIFKVGLELFTAEGPPLVRALGELGKSVFLDLKLHDIPNTVAEVVRVGVRLGAAMMTIHTSGGEDMMRKAAEAASAESGKTKTARPLLLGVTILTSLKNDDLEAIGMAPDTSGQVLRLAGLAKKSGLDGIVCSAQEIEIARRELGTGFVIVTPGIRPAWAPAHDQKRIMTPSQAIQKGSDYLVVGRPITQATSPSEAFLKILEEIEKT